MAVQVQAVIAVGRVQPLVRMLVMHVGLVGGVVDVKLDVVAQIAVVHVGGIVRIKYGGCRFRVASRNWTVFAN